MEDSYLDLAREASSLCEVIKAQLESLEAEIAFEESAVAGCSGSKFVEVIRMTELAKAPDVAEKLDITKTPVVVREKSTPARQGVDPAPVHVSQVSAPEVALEFEDFGTASEDKQASLLDQSNLDLMLQRSVKASTLAKYLCL
jgi:hypothetical protein